MVRRSLVRLLAAVAVSATGLLGVGTPAHAQEQTLDVVEVDTSSHPDVRVVVAAPRDLVGREIPAEGFTLTEDGESRGFDVTRLPNDALEVVLVVDTSGSMAGEAMTAAKNSAVSFVEQMPPGTRIGLVRFSDTAEVLSPFDTNPEALTTAIDGLEAGGETALYDALTATITSFRGSPDSRRAIVLLSDGGDTVSETSLEAVTDQMRGLDADFVAIALATEDSAEEILGGLAGAADGRVVSADAPDELAAVYDDIASRLVNQYQLAYTSSSEGATEIAVSVEHEGVAAAAVSEIELPALPDDSGLAGSGEVTVPASEPRVAPDPGFLGGSWTFAVGAGAFAIAFASAGWVLVSSREPRRRLAHEFAERREGMSGRLVSEFAGRASEAAERMLERQERMGRLNAALDRAGIVIRPGEFVLLVVSVAAFMGALGLAMGGLLGGIALGALTLLGSRMVVSVVTERRRARFADQLGDTIQLLAGSLRTGYGLIQSVDAVAREAPSPTADEFRRIIIETQLGRDINESLQAGSDRMGNEDFDWIVQAIEINRDVGGDLAEVLDQVGETIRDRNRIRGQVKALSAEGRLSAVILFILPFAVAVVINATNPEYLAELTDTSLGNVMLGVAAGLMVIGGLWMRRMIRMEF